MVSTLPQRGLLDLAHLDQLVNEILLGRGGDTGISLGDIQRRLHYTMKFSADDVNLDDIRILVKKLRQHGVYISEKDVAKYNDEILKRYTSGRKSRIRKRRKTKSKTKTKRR